MAPMLVIERRVGRMPSQQRGRPAVEVLPQKSGLKDCSRGCAPRGNARRRKTTSATVFSGEMMPNRFGKMSRFTAVDPHVAPVLSCPAGGHARRPLAGSCGFEAEKFLSGFCRFGGEPLGAPNKAAAARGGKGCRDPETSTSPRHDVLKSISCMFGHRGAPIPSQTVCKGLKRRISGP